MSKPLTFKKLISLCEKDLKNLKIDFNALSNEQKVEKIFAIFFRKIFERSQVTSVKFSDYLKEEPHLDYYFFKLCKKVFENKNSQKKKNKFGIFDIEKIKNRASLEIKTEDLTDDQFDLILKD